MKNIKIELFFFINIGRMDEISFKNDLYLEYISGIDANIHMTFINFITKIVKKNTIELNKNIINYYSGDIHNAIEIYKIKHNNNFEYEDKKDFYAKLALISLYTKFNYLTKNNLFIV